MTHTNHIPQITAEEAAEMILDGATIGFSGFTPAAAVKRWQNVQKRFTPTAALYASAS